MCQGLSSEWYILCLYVRTCRKPSKTLVLGPGWTWHKPPCIILQSLRSDGSRILSGGTLARLRNLLSKTILLPGRSVLSSASADSFEVASSCVRLNIETNWDLSLFYLLLSAPVMVEKVAFLVLSLKSGEDWILGLLGSFEFRAHCNVGTLLVSLAACEACDVRSPLLGSRLWELHERKWPCFWKTSFVNVRGLEGVHRKWKK